MNLAEYVKELRNPIIESEDYERGHIDGFNEGLEHGKKEIIKCLVELEQGHFNECLTIHEIIRDIVNNIIKEG